MVYETPIHIVAARRSPIGRFDGGLKKFTAPELASHTAEATVPEALRPHIDQVILGQILQAGTGMNTARQVGLKLGIPQATPAFTVNMVCGSGLKAVALGADAIEQDEASLILAGGVESMSNAPHYAMDARFGKKLGEPRLRDAILTDGLSDPILQRGMGDIAEELACEYDISREEQDKFALQSQQRAAAAREAFAREIVPMGEVEADEHPRPDTTQEKLASLLPAFAKEGTITAGNASGINDGSATLLLANDTALTRHDLESRAHIIGATALGCDPARFGMGPVGAVQSLCEQIDWDLAGVDAVEINEAFAVQTLACARDLSLSDAQLNPRGGAIALGHPIGTSGARILVTLLHHLEDANANRGIATLCVGGGMGIAIAIERG